MTQTFYTQWQSSVLADAETYVSKEYSNFQTALLREISKYAEAVDAAVVSENKGHYYTSCFIERNGKFVYINHSGDKDRTRFVHDTDCPARKGLYRRKQSILRYAAVTVND